MLDFGGMSALTAVAQSGSVSTAAKILHITPSAVSQRIAKLERETGQVLLERRGRGVQLTGAGKLLVGRTEHILAMMDETVSELELYKGSVTGEVRIAGFASAVRGLMPAALADLRSDFPNLRVAVYEQEPKESIVGVVRGDLDLAIIQDWDSARLALSADLVSATLLDDLFDVALPSSHRLAGRLAVSMADIAHESWVTWPRGWQCHDWLVETLQAAGADPDIVYMAGEHTTQLAMVAAGFGLAVIPRLGREPVPDGVRMVRLPPEFQRHVHAVWRKSTDNRPAIRSAVLALKAAARATAGSGSLAASPDDLTTEAS